MKPIRSRALVALLSLPVALTLVACGAGANSDSKSSATGGGSASAAEPAPADGLSSTSDFGSSEKTGADKSVSRDAAIQRAVIATGSLSLTTRHLDDVRQDAMNLVKGLGGNVAEEQSQSDTHGRLDRVDLTLRVPAASFERALDGLGGLGTVRHRQQSVEDVTTQVIDNNARVKAQEASVESIERLLAHATTIAEIISVEQQLSSRQADLDSLKQQQKWLADQTSMSTIQLTMTRPSKKPVEAGTGFFSGFGRGWHALGRSTVAVGTALGAVLPFAVLLALVGTPVWLVVRRRRVVAPAPAAEA
jgi:hypothetical protein